MLIHVAWVRRVWNVKQGVDYECDTAPHCWGNCVVVDMCRTWIGEVVFSCCVWGAAVAVKIY
ncbi:MAG: hypothetical protein MIO93_14600 [ANME-2 cluster archaeon]|nr:hypothetical protein [ANME-2 cluster archaeon]